MSDRRFDEILLVEKDARRCKELEERMNVNEDERITTVNKDANCFLQSLSRDWKTHRGVLFLDPFATEVEWLTIEKGRFPIWCELCRIRGDMDHEPRRRGWRCGGGWRA